MSKQALFIFFIVLLLILGGVVWYAKIDVLKYILIEEETTLPVVEKPQTPPLSLSKPLPSKVSMDDMKKLAVGPAKSAKELELKKYSDDVNAVAVSSQILEISSCTPVPNILSFDVTKPLTLVNRDSIPHTISVNIQGKTTVLSEVKPQSQNKVTLGDVLKTGIYSYICDSVGPSGMFLVQ